MVRVHPPPPSTMTFLLLGILLLVFGTYFFRQASKEGDKEGVVGFSAIIIAAAILTLFYGLFYTLIIT